MTEEIKRQPCEIYTRCVGYYRPVKDFNDSKQEEFKDRVTFKLDKKFAKEYMDKPIPYTTQEVQ